MNLREPPGMEVNQRASFLFSSPCSSMLNEANTSSTISCDSPLGTQQDEEQGSDPQLGCQEPTTGHHEVEESFL